MNQAQARSRLQPAAESLNRVVAADVEDVPDRPAKKGSPGLWAQLCNAPRALGHRAGCNPKYAQTWRVLLLLAAILLVTTGQAYWKSAHGHRSDHGLRQKDFRPHERSAHVPPAVVADAPTPAPAPDPPRVKRRLTPASVDEAAAFIKADPSTVSTFDKQRTIAAMIKWAWGGYRKYAWPMDEFHPYEKHGSEWLRMGATIVDGLDTLYLAGLTEEFKEARDWTAHTLNVGQDLFVNVFETTIRMVGGLMSASYLQGGDEALVKQAEDLVSRMLPAFNTGLGIPLSDSNPAQRTAKRPAWSPYSSMAEATTLRMEYAALSHATGKRSYVDAAARAQMAVINIPKDQGLAPTYVDPDHGTWGNSLISLGSRGDSYYEYLLKSYLHEGKTDKRLLAAFQESMAGIANKLFHRSKTEGLLFVAELDGRLSGKMDHLVCFLPGMLALAHENGLRPAESSLATYTRLGLKHNYLDPARALAYTCQQFYNRTATRLAPEIAFFNAEGINEEGTGVAFGDVHIKPFDAHCLLRPEAVESWFVLFRVTGDEMYRDWGWDFARALERYARVGTGGYTSLDNVMNVPEPGHGRDKMESFFLAETCKYLLLLFGDSDVVPLDKFVLNTEAHPLPIFEAPWGETAGKGGGGGAGGAKETK